MYMDTVPERRAVRGNGNCLALSPAVAVIAAVADCLAPAPQFNECAIPSIFVALLEAVCYCGSKVLV